MMNLDLELSLLCISTPVFPECRYRILPLEGSQVFWSPGVHIPVMFLNTDGGGGGGGGSDVGWSQWVECGLDLGLCLHSLCKQWYAIIFSPVHSQFTSWTWNAVCRVWTWCFSRWIYPLQDGPGCGSIHLHQYNHVSPKTSRSSKHTACWDFFPQGKVLMTAKQNSDSFLDVFSRKWLI